LCSHIDRKAIHSHPPCITPRNQSSVSKSYSAFGPSESGVTALQAPTGAGAGAASSTAGRAPPPTPSRAQPAPPPRAVRAKANWDFTSEDPNELPFRTGDIVTILSQNGEWWSAELNGRTGLIPANYVTLI